jgi:hypothetical protein
VTERERVMAILENIATLIVSAALVLGLYWMGAGGWAGIGFAVLFNLNTFEQLRK